MEAIDGFWLPRAVRQRLLAGHDEYATLSYARGQRCEPGGSGAVTVRWPVLGPGQWTRLLAELRAGREAAPQGDAFWTRLQAAMGAVARRMADPADELGATVLTSLPGYTGYSAAMIGLALGSPEMWSLEALRAAFRQAPPAARDGWQRLGELPGRLRWYGRARWPHLPAGLTRGQGRPLFGTPAAPELAVGYGAGNVPGTALLLLFMVLATTLAGGPVPVGLVKNSRREPILAPLVLSALEAEDPDLLGSAALLIWDYDDEALQERLLGQAGLVLAAASDETIARLDGLLARTSVLRGGRPGGTRFHRHGHKVSFTAIGREMLAHGRRTEPGGPDLIDAVALLAALDSAIWDQHGCLSSRVHFVESGGEGHYTALDYAQRLAEQLGRLATLLPRGAWPRQRLHDRFDRYKLLEPGGQVRVLSGYDDDLVVILDERPPDAARFQAVVNDCEGRVVAVCPVAALADVPARYLRLIPAANLQSLSVAVGQPGGGLDDAFLSFAAACGARGVTAIRTVGRGAFPQLAYSWDGLIPLDLVSGRPPGYFTTIEFESPYDQVLANYQLLIQRGAAR